MSESRYLKAMLEINRITMEPFVWGKSDCFSMTARVVLACTGKDWRDGYRYATKQQADAFIAANGGVEKLLRVVLAGQPDAPGDAVDDGDPLLINLPGVGLAAGVKLGNRAVVRTEVGVVSIPIKSERVLRGWRV